MSLRIRNYRRARLAGAPVLAALAAACGAGSQGGSADVAAAAEAITAESLLANIRTLSSDAFEGRAPGTPGEDSTVAFLTEQFRALGLQPGHPDGGWTQDVPLVGITTRTTASIRVGGRTVPLSFPENFVGVSKRVTPEVRVDGSDVVFVGYGVEAPEYGWDDYKGVDVAGKTIIMLINDPAVPDPNDPSRLDPSMFKGDAMTYYGRWTYKYEIATEKGAAAAIIVHETGPAGYPWEVVTGSWGRENFDIVTPDGNMGRVAIEGWITVDKARELFAAAGQDFDALKEAARRPDFKPVPLNAKATFRAANTFREVQSRNVVAKLEGSDPQRRDEYVIYTAHWDHLGKDPSLEGDQIYNGALDNATGTAGLIELARAFTQLPEPPARSILFLAVTAEEQGLLGAKYYAQNPLYPLDRTLANINIDGLNQWGRTEDIVVVGYGNSTLDDILAAEAERGGRVVVPDPEPEKGFFYRSDHFEFAKQGVPALYTDAGTRYIGKPEGYGEQKREEYTANDYHAPGDEVKPDWDLAGAVDDLRLLFAVGYRVATDDAWPEWKAGTEFKAKREAMLAGQ
ncbi:MAG TPA: M28 family metallopeptidase [Longimicrobiales bacterium]